MTNKIPIAHHIRPPQIAENAFAADDKRETKADDEAAWQYR